MEKINYYFMKVAAKIDITGECKSFLVVLFCVFVSFILPLSARWFVYFCLFVYLFIYLFNYLVV